METDFGDAFFKGVREILKNPSGGMFIDACYAHSVSNDEHYWSPNSTVKLGNLVSFFLYKLMSIV